MSLRVLVVGGAGYIGSICTRLLREEGLETVVLDDLSTGHRDAVEGPFIHADVLSTPRLVEVLRGAQFDAVMHFASRIQVGESVHKPLSYYSVNLGGSLSLLRAMAETNTRNLVFSSTCAIYGDPQYLPLDEEHPIAPLNPYGHTKAMVEHVLDQCREREGFHITALRYFNAAGASLDGRLGESHPNESHLLPLALGAAMGKRGPLKVFGTDYDSVDGTAIRDYIHVVDLAKAHLLALRRLVDGSPGTSYNVGTGVGSTVRQVLESVERVTGRPVPASDAPRRDGDSPALFANGSKIRRELGWEPTHSALDQIVASAARWEQNPRY